ncbi:MAG TPA: hypothetical protein V6D17_03995 [Candidatus Obscuribacterales bacterium]
MNKRLTPKVQVNAVFLVVAMIAGSSTAAIGQIQTLRNPLIPGATYSPPYACPPEGCPPPPGDGQMPAPVTPGHTCAPESMPWVRAIPANQIDQPNSWVGGLPSEDTLASPYVLGKQLNVPHPPSVPGSNPGSLPGPLDFQPPPAAIVNIRPQGGMPGDFAPQQRWGGQTTRDFGLYKSQGSRLNDFGEKLTEKPDLYTMPQFSEDGPRNGLSYPGRMGNQPAHSKIWPNAQTTQDLHGNRTLFKGPNLRSQLTIAPY